MKTAIHDELTIEDKVDSDGDVLVYIEKDNESYESTWVNKENAKDIIRHLTKIFRL